MHTARSFTSVLQDKIQNEGRQRVLADLSSLVPDTRHNQPTEKACLHPSMAGIHDWTRFAR
jgi:hypothetical protein